MDVKGAKALSERLAEAARTVYPPRESDSWPNRSSEVGSGQGHCPRLACFVSRLRLLPFRVRAVHAGTEAEAVRRLLLPRRPVGKLLQLIGATNCEVNQLDLVRCQLAATSPFNLRAQMLLDRESREVTERITDPLHPQATLQKEQLRAEQRRVLREALSTAG